MPTSSLTISGFTASRILCRSSHFGERGIVLILTLILLVIISLLSVVTLRNVGSAESTAGNVRTTELATQSAEIALRYCETSVLRQMTFDAGGAPTYPKTSNDANILPSASPPDSPNWQKRALWDSASNAVLVVPMTLLNQPGMVITTYKRPSECMVERLQAVSGSDPASYFVITSRGFGPEVPAVDGLARPRPSGSELWFQSVIKVGTE